MRIILNQILFILRLNYVLITGVPSMRTREVKNKNKIKFNLTITVKLINYFFIYQIYLSHVAVKINPLKIIEIYKENLF
jgi:hypothetical protein